MAKKWAHTLKALVCGRRGSRGESLVEVLTSIVIGGLALLMLGMAISTAANMATNSRDAMGDYYQASSAMASGGATSLGSNSITLTQGGSTLALVSSDESVRAEYYASSGIGSSTIVVYNAGDDTSGGGA